MLLLEDVCTTSEGYDQPGVPEGRRNQKKKNNHRNDNKMKMKKKRKKSKKKQMKNKKRVHRSLHEGF